MLYWRWPWPKGKCGSHTIGQKKKYQFFIVCFLYHKIGGGVPYCNNEGRVDQRNTGGGMFALPSGPQQRCWSPGKERGVPPLFCHLLLCIRRPAPSIRHTALFSQGQNMCVRCQRFCRQNAPWWINGILTRKNDPGCWAQIHTLSTLVKFWRVAHPVLSTL